jgi:hypothetical protein
MFLAKDKELVSVEEELALPKHMNLLKMRFEDSLEYELKVVNQIQKLK